MIVVYGGYRLLWFETWFRSGEEKTNAKTDEKTGVSWTRNYQDWVVI